MTVFVVFVVRLSFIVSDHLACEQRERSGAIFNSANSQDQLTIWCSENWSLSSLLVTFKNRQHLTNHHSTSAPSTQLTQAYEATSSTTSSSSSLGLCQEIYYHDPTFSEGESILEVKQNECHEENVSSSWWFSLQALQGFIIIVSCDGELFFASRTVEQYLGFHQVNLSPF